MSASSAGSNNGTVVRHNRFVNGSEKVCEWEDSDGSMEGGSEGENGGSPTGVWKEVRSNRAEKRKERISSDGSDRQCQENIKCIVRFGDQYGVSWINPLKLTKMINKSIGNIDFAKVLPDGNLLGCNNEEQASFKKSVELKLFYQQSRRSTSG